MKNLRPKNQPPTTDLIQNYLESSWDTVVAVYNNLDLLVELGTALENGEIDQYLIEADIDTQAKINAILTDIQLGRFSTQGEAEGGTNNDTTMTPLRVQQAIATFAPQLQNDYDHDGPPTVTHDSDSGWSPGSIIIDTTADPDESYRCSDASVGAAVWIKTTLTTDELALVAISGDSDDLIEGSIKLLMTVAERSKLGGIEDGATDDLTGAEIAALLYAESDTNQYTDAEKTKLDTIEDSATVDQTDAEIVTGYNNLVVQVSPAERTAGTETAIRRYSPADIADMADTHGGGGGGAASPLTTKGDLWGFSTVDARFPVGADGTVITADPVEAFGYKWSVPLINAIDTYTTDGSVPALSSSAYATKGTIFSVAEDRELTRVFATVDGDAAATYKIVIATVGAADPYTISALLDESSVFPADVAAHDLSWQLDTPLSLTVGTNYAFMVVRTDSTSTAICETPFEAALPDADPELNIEYVASIRYASNDPAVSDSTYYDATSHVYFNLKTDSTYAVNTYGGTGGGGGLAVEFKTASFTAEAGYVYKVDTTGGPIDVTMPAGTDADHIVIQDTGHYAGTNNITITPDGLETVDGDTVHVIDQDDAEADMGYESADTNWATRVDGKPTLMNVNDFATGFSATNPQTGTTYEFVEGNLTQCVTANNAAASTYDIPDGLAEDGETLSLYNKGAGEVTITVAGSDTLGSTDNKCVQYKAITILCEDGDTWYVIGGSA